MRWHVIAGEAGCEYAVARDCAAIVVDTLRASATAAMLLAHGARGILVTREVETALEARRLWGDGLAYGERDAVPPPGFDHGNSPLETEAARGRHVAFTTTTGARRLVACWGARAAYLGGPVNCAAVVAAAASHGTDVVVIPAGLADHPHFNSQEDWVGACLLALRSGARVGEGYPRFVYWRDRIAAEGVPALVAASPHAAQLRRKGFGADIEFCGREDVTTAVPLAVDRNRFGVLLRDAGPEAPR